MVCRILPIEHSSQTAQPNVHFPRLNQFTPTVLALQSKCPGPGNGKTKQKDKNEKQKQERAQEKNENENKKRKNL